MTRIGLISDTHGYLDESVFEHFKNCDEVWHIGDFGNIHLVHELLKGLKNNAASTGRPIELKGVYGNIDGQDIRKEFGEQMVFLCEGVKVMLRHIGGYPPNYNPATKKEMKIHKPQLIISGHSHILKIMYDELNHCLHINPGAAGNHGWHKVRTIVRFVIDGSQMKDAEVIELGVK